jgi:hypothetical protein
MWKRCFHKVSPFQFVEFADHIHMATASRYLCGGITNLFHAYYALVQTQCMQTRVVVL